MTNPYFSVSSSSSSSLSKLNLKIRHELLKLSDRDPHARRSAMETLKSLVQSDLDTRAIPCFVEAISSVEIATASAICLFSELARVHTWAAGQFIPRIMSVLIRCLSSATSFGRTGLHQACADVVSSLARYSIGTTPSIISSDESKCLSSSPSSSSSSHDTIISCDDSMLSSSSSSTTHDHDALFLHGLLQPLLSVLSSNLDHVSMGSATCLKALITSENWSKHASSDLATSVCHRASMCLVKKKKKKKLTTAHFGLVQALAERNASYLHDYQALLLQVCAEVIVVDLSGDVRSRASQTWQVRVAAAQLIGSLIGHLGGSQALAPELGPVIQALDKARLDPALKVRQAVTRALATANECKEKEETLLDLKKTMPRQRKSVRRSWDSSALSSSGGGIEDMRIGESSAQILRRKTILKTRVEESLESSALSSGGGGIKDPRVRESLEKRISRRKSLGNLGKDSSESCGFSGDGIEDVRGGDFPERMLRSRGESSESSTVVSDDIFVVDSHEYSSTVMTDSISSCSSLGSVSEIGLNTPYPPTKQLSVPLLSSRSTVDSELEYLLAQINLLESKEIAPLSTECIKSEDLSYMHMHVGSKSSNEVEVDQCRENELDVDQCRENELDIDQCRENELDMNQCRENEVDIDQCRENEVEIDDYPQSTLNSDGSMRFLSLEKPLEKSDDEDCTEDNDASRKALELTNDEVVTISSEDDSVGKVDSLSSECRQPSSQVIKSPMSTEDYISSNSRRLVRSTRDSRGTSFESMALDFDLETLSELGWSVRENPIAGDTIVDDLSRHTHAHTLLFKKDIQTKSLDMQTKISSSRISSETHFDEGFVDNALASSGPLDFCSRDHMNYNILNCSGNVHRHETEAHHIYERESNHMHEADLDHTHGYKDNVSFSSLDLPHTLCRVRLKNLGVLLIVLIFTTVIAIFNDINGQDKVHMLVPT